MLNYQRRVCELIEKHTTRKVSKALEIGGLPDDREVSRLLLSEIVHDLLSININKNLVDVSDGRYSFKVMDARNIRCGNESFELIYGTAILEHINDLDAFFQSVYDAATKNGLVVFHGGPLWASHWGHHLWIKTKSNVFSFNGTRGENPLPNWSHLFWSKKEMETYLIEKGLTVSDSKAICEMVYDSDTINREPYDNIIQSAIRAGFNIVEVIGEEWKRPPAEVLNKISVDNPSIGSMYLVLKKYN